jgi:hypothetical protein
MSLGHATLRLRARRYARAGVERRTRARSGWKTCDMGPVHISDASTSQQAREAIRDILYLYRELTFYEGIQGDHDTGSFDPWTFLQGTAYGGWVTEDDLKLLHEGSAVALVCDLIDEIEQRAGDTERYSSELRAGAFDDHPPAKAAVLAGVESGRDALLSAVAPVYQKYVQTYFANLVSQR